MRLNVEKIVECAGGLAAMNMRWTLARRAKPSPEALLDLACRIDDVCKCAGFRPLLAYGTLLGAVRQGGIIEGDEDVDMIVLSEDADKLQACILGGQFPGMLVARADQGYVTLTDAKTSAHADLYVYFPSVKRDGVYSHCMLDHGRLGLPYTELELRAPITMGNHSFMATLYQLEHVKRFYGDTWFTTDKVPRPQIAYEPGAQYDGPAPCFVNVSVGGPYPLGQQRLLASIDKHCPTWQRHMFTDRFPAGSPSHADVPYAFKHYALRSAQRAGHTMLVWIDSSCVLIKPPTGLVAAAREDGYAVSCDGWDCGQWTSDEMACHFGYSRSELSQLPTCAATCYALDLAHPVGRRILAMLEDAELVFKGDWRNVEGSVSKDPRCRGHRHDQAALALILYRQHLPMTTHPNWFAYGKLDELDKVDPSVSVLCVGAGA
jgi:hypothetical protein